MRTFVGTIEVRKAEATDFDPIVTMCKSSMVATYGSFLTEEAMRPWSEGDETEKHVRKTLNETLVAVEHSRIVGVVSIEGDGIGLLWVGLAERGRGIGTMLLSHAETALAERGYARARVECFEPNRDAIRFYERNDWRPVRSYVEESSGVGMVVMEKPLTADPPARHPG